MNEDYIIIVTRILGIESVYQVLDEIRRFEHYDGPKICVKMARRTDSYQRR